MHNYSIVIPCYNEFNNLIKLIPEIESYINDHTCYELIIVNDFSNDKTGNIKEYLNTKIDVKLINNNKNMGQSFSIYQGVKNSKYENIITLDGDCQNNPKDIVRLVGFYEEKSLDLIGGIRKKRKDSRFKKISSFLANKIRKFILNDKCDDSACGLKVFKKKYFLAIPLFSGLHRFLPALFKGMRCKVLYIEIDHRERNSGKSNYGNFIRLIYGIRDILRVLVIKKRIKID